jgi:hypothetical protein
MESATIIIFFARLIHFQGGEGGCEKEYSLYACDNDEKDGRPLRSYVVIELQISGLLYSFNNRQLYGYAIGNYMVMP